MNVRKAVQVFSFSLINRISFSLLFAHSFQFQIFHGAIWKPLCLFPCLLNVSFMLTLAYFLLSSSARNAFCGVCVAPTHKTVPTKTWTFGQSVSQHLSCLFSTLKIYMNVIYHIKSSFIFDIFIQQTYIKNMSEFIKKEKNITVGKYSRYIRWYNKATTVTIICQTLCLALYMRCLI